MVETREAWCEGVEGVIQIFGDYLPCDEGVLAKISNTVQETVTSSSFASVDQ